jgi:membrane-bound lytic murein transglycosylase B
MIFSFCFAENVFAATYKLSDYQIVQKFIAKMVYQYNFDKNYLIETLNSTTLIGKVTEDAANPYEEKPWNIYKKHFLTQSRIEKGVEYWGKHKETLAFAEKHFGVPASIIVAIIGIESNYGETKMPYPVLNTLATLSFTPSTRADFFQYELAEYFLLTRELNIDPRTIKGSYSGAIGIPQFMPSSYRHFAISYQKGKMANLITNDNDTIVSIANFLNHFGWQKNQPIAIPAIISTQNYKYETLLNSSLQPQHTLNTLAKYHITPAKMIAKNALVNLFQFENQNNTCEYWLGLQNFYVLSHYNPNKQYVLTVYLLAQKIEQQRK